MLLAEEREKIISVSLGLMAEKMITNGQGNLSIMDRDQNLIAITPSAVPYQEREPEDICVVDPQGNLIEGNWKPTSEMALHLVYYRSRADVNAVVHTHAPNSTVFGIIGDEPMPMVLNEAAMGLGGAVPIAPYARPGTERLAELTCQATGDGIAVIMAHHGLVTLGDTLERAYTSTAAAEATAKAIILARSMDAEVNILEDEEVNTLRKMYLGYGPQSIA